MQRSSLGDRHNFFIFSLLFFFYQPTQYAKGTHYDNRLSDSLLAITTSMLIIPTQI